MPEIITVEGPIPPDRLGVTMPHTHLIMDLTCWLVRPKEEWKVKKYYEAPVSMEILGYLRRDCWASKDNVLTNDIDLAAKELMEYRVAGGDSIVELTLPGIGRDPLGMRRISRATGVNVVCATGWYISRTHPPFIKKKSVDELCDIMVKELTEGIDDTGIRAGVIGEVACSGGYGVSGLGDPRVPFDADEEKVLRAAAKAQAKTGAALTIHPNVAGEPWIENYLDVIEEEAADLKKYYQTHMDFFVNDLKIHQRVLDRGVTISYDDIGEEAYFDSYEVGSGWPSDRERINTLVELIKMGYEKQIVLSTEVCLKIFYKKYGGGGFSHVLEYTIPELKNRGVSDSQIRQMMIETPRRLLAF